MFKILVRSGFTVALLLSAGLTLPVRAQSITEDALKARYQKSPIPAIKPADNTQQNISQNDFKAAVQLNANAANLDAVIKQRISKGKDIPDENEMASSVVKFLNTMTEPGFKFFEIFNSKSSFEGFEFMQSEDTQSLLKKSRLSEDASSDRIIDEKTEEKLDALKAFTGIKFGTDAEKTSKFANMNPSEANDFLANSFLKAAFDQLKK